MIPVSLAGPDPVAFDDPQLAVTVVRFEHSQPSPQDAGDLRHALPCQPRYEQTRIVGRRVGSDVGEISVECDEGPVFLFADQSNPAVRPPGEELVEDAERIMAGSTQEVHCLYRKVLIRFESQALARLRRQAEDSLVRQFGRVGDGGTHQESHEEAHRPECRNGQKAVLFPAREVW